MFVEEQFQVAVRGVLMRQKWFDLMPDHEERERVAKVVYKAWIAPFLKLLEESHGQADIPPKGLPMDLTPFEEGYDTAAKEAKLTRDQLLELIEMSYKGFKWIYSSHFDGPGIMLDAELDAVIRRPTSGQIVITTKAIARAQASNPQHTR